jgi:hypothetical protein
MGIAKADDYGRDIPINVDPGFLMLLSAIVLEATG